VPFITALGVLNCQFLVWNGKQGLLFISFQQTGHISCVLVLRTLDEKMSTKTSICKMRNETGKRWTERQMQYRMG
jgi:hypothetical protein